MQTAGAAYALLAYQTAYLKSHHPAEFMAATLTSEMSDSARIVTLIEECRRMRLEVLPPDVNRSAWGFTLEGGRIRFGLGAVRNVGQQSVEAIVAARAGMPLARRMVQDGEPVATGLADFVCEKSALRQKAVERARALASGPDAAYQANKKFINASLKAALQAAFAEAGRL